MYALIMEEAQRGLLSLPHWVWGNAIATTMSTEDRLPHGWALLGMFDGARESLYAIPGQRLPIWHPHVSEYHVGLDAALVAAHIDRVYIDRVSELLKEDRLEEVWDLIDPLLESPR